MVFALWENFEKKSFLWSHYSDASLSKIVSWRLNNDSIGNIDQRNRFVFTDDKFKPALSIKYIKSNKGPKMDHCRMPILTKDLETFYIVLLLPKII